MRGGKEGKTVRHNFCHLTIWPACPRPSLSHCLSHLSAVLSSCASALGVLSVACSHCVSNLKLSPKNTAALMIYSTDESRWFADFPLECKLLLLDGCRTPENTVNLEDKLSLHSCRERWWRSLYYEVTSPLYYYVALDKSLTSLSFSLHLWNEVNNTLLMWLL